MKSFGSIRQPFRVISIATRLCYVLLAVCLPCSAVGHYDMTYPNRGSMLAAGWDFAARTVAGLVRDTEQTSGAVVSYDQSSHPGVLRIPVGSGDLWGSANNTQNSIFRNLPENWNTIRLKLSFAPTVNYQSASLVAYQDDETYAQVAVVYSNGARIVLNQEQNGGANTLVEAAASQSTVYLRLDRNITTETISGWYSTNGTTWISLGSMSLRLIMPRLGIVTGGSPNSFPSADISWAEVDVDPTHPPNYVSAYPSYHLFKAVAGGPAPSAQTASIISTAEGSVVGWSQTTNVPWLQVSPANGSSTGTLSISVNPAGLSAGVYNGTISVTPDISGGAVQMIPVTLVVKPDIPVSAATWLNGRKGALSVSVDDAYASCSNQLTASGFTGTYVTNGYSAPSFYTQYYGAGMELGSHLTVHACSTMNDALLTQYITLNIAAVCTPNTPAACASISTLAWPCGVTAEREKRIADQYFTSARGYNFNQLEEATPADFQNLKSYNSHEHSPIPPADLKTVVDAAEAQGKWANLVFHASCNDDGAISYAATKNIWAAPIGTVIRYILQRDRVVLSNYQTTAQKVSFSVSRLAIPAKTFLNVEQTLGAADKVTLQVALTGTPQISAVLVNGVSTPFQTENTQTGKTVYVNVLVDGSTKTVEVLTSAAAVSGLTLNPTSLSGGAGSLGTVTLNRPAPAGGIGVTLGSSSGAASVPPSVTVLEGAMSATFNINTSTVAVSTAVTVTATLGSSSSAVLTVVPALTSIAVTPSNPSIAKGLTQAFTATGTYTGGGTQNLTALVAWTSSNTSAATIVSSGLATGVGVGSSTIQATFGSVSGSTGITVLAPQLVSIAVTPGNASVLVGGTQAYAATGLYTDGSTQNVTSSVTWSSSSPAVATITAAGVATGVALGTTTVQATVGSISGSTSLMVASSLPGLVGGWNFNETSGTTAADSSGGGHPAALVNGPVWTAGQVGNAVSADGSNDSVNIPSIDLSGTSAVTLSMWVNRTYFNSGDRVLAEASANYNDTNSGFMLLMDNSSCGGIQLSLHGNAGYNVGCFTAPTSGVWHHLTVVFDKSQPGTGEIAFYIDGVLQTPRSSPIANNNTDTFGNNPIYLFSRGGSALFTAGMMDELRIYNRALSPSEVQQVYMLGGQ